MDNPFPRYDLFSCELGMENDGYDDNNDNDENITIGSLEDFADLIFFLFSWNAFKNPNGIIDGRPKTCFWLRRAVYHICAYYHISTFYHILGMQKELWLVQNSK